MLTDQQKLARGTFAYEMREQKGEPVKKQFRKISRGKTYRHIHSKPEIRYCWSGLAFEIMRKEPPTFSFETRYTPRVEMYWHNGTPRITGISLADAICEWLGISNRQYHAMVTMNDTTDACWGVLANTTHTLPPPEEEKK